MASTFLVRRGSDEFLLCRRAHDAGARAIRFRDTSALTFLRSCITTPDLKQRLRLWILADPRPRMELGDDEDLFEHVARRITTGLLFVAKVETEGAGIAGVAGEGILRPAGQSTAKSKSSSKKKESTPLEDETARREDAAAEAEEVDLAEQEEVPETTWIEIE